MITKELVEQWAKDCGTGFIPITDLDIKFAQRAAAYGAEQRERELLAMGVSAKHLGWTPHNLEPIYGYTAEQLAAARLQGAEEERKKQVAPVVEQVVKLMQASTVNQGLRDALQTIARWNSHTTELSIDYGSSGVRDFYRNIARAAIVIAAAEQEKTKS